MFDDLFSMFHYCLSFFCILVCFLASLNMFVICCAILSIRTTKIQNKYKIASKPASQKASKQASQQASKLASQPASKPASKPASQPGECQQGRKTCCRKQTLHIPSPTMGGGWWKRTVLFEEGGSRGREVEKDGPFRRGRRGSSYHHIISSHHRIISSYHHIISSYHIIILSYHIIMSYHRLIISHHHVIS